MPGKKRDANKTISLYHDFKTNVWDKAVSIENFENLGDSWLSRFIGGDDENSAYFIYYSEKDKFRNTVNRFTKPKKNPVLSWLLENKILTGLIAGIVSIVVAVISNWDKIKPTENNSVIICRINVENSQNPTAYIYLDGNVIDTIFLDKSRIVRIDKVPKGVHEVTVSIEGFNATRKEVSIKENKEYEVIFNNFDKILETEE